MGAGSSLPTELAAGPTKMIAPRIKTALDLLRAARNGPRGPNLPEDFYENQSRRLPRLRRAADH